MASSAVGHNKAGWPAAGVDAALGTSARALSAAEQAATPGVASPPLLRLAKKASNASLRATAEAGVKGTNAAVPEVAAGVGAAVSTAVVSSGNSLA